MINSLLRVVLVVCGAGALECYSCDSGVSEECAHVDLVVKRNNTRVCDSNTTRCLKAVYDTTQIDEFKRLFIEDEASEYQPKSLRVVRKCYDTEIFALPLNIDCQEREKGFLRHVFCLCEGNLCNSAPFLTFAASYLYFLFLLFVVD